MQFRKEQAAALRSSRRLIILFAVLIMGMVFVANAVLALAWLVSFGGLNFQFPKYFFTVNTALILLYVLGSCVLEMSSLKAGGESLARQAGGRGLDEPQNIHEKRVGNVVMEVAVATGIKPPRVFLLAQEDAINAFAAGWDEKDSVIAVTRGAMERLTRDELQGVVAHEFSHILNGDMRLNMRLMSMVLGLQMLYNFGSMLVAAGDIEGKIPIKILFGYAFMSIGWMGWLAGRILCASVSRQREFLADASAVKYTRLSQGIAGALRKIAYQQGQGRGMLKQNEAKRMAPLLLHFEQVSKWLATHPPISERLKRLNMPYTRFEVKDDFQDVRFDEFLPNRLVAHSELTPRLRMAAARWGGVNPQPRVFATPVARAQVELPQAWQLDQIKAELYLDSKDLSKGRLKAAILAFWVAENQKATKDLWEQICRTMELQIPFQSLTSVCNLAPQLREPMFERLVERMQVFSSAERQELQTQAQQIFDGQVPGKQTPQAWLRLATLGYWLGEFKEYMSSEHGSLREVQNAVALLTSFMANALEVKNSEIWSQMVLQDLGINGFYTEQPSPQQLEQAVKDMHDGTSLLAPMVIKAWLVQWQRTVASCSLEKQQYDADMLWLMCALLDIARPELLQQYYKIENNSIVV